MDKWLNLLSAISGIRRAGIVRKGKEKVLADSTRILAGKVERIYNGRELET